MQPSVPVKLESRLSPSLIYEKTLAIEISIANFFDQLQVYSITPCVAFILILELPLHHTALCTFFAEPKLMHAGPVFDIFLVNTILHEILLNIFRCCTVELYFFL